MLTFLSDALLVAIIIAGPLLLAAFFIYGANATRKMDGQPEIRASTERATKELYQENEAERDAKEKAAEKSDKLVDSLKRRTGTTG